jgi:hypothetical protein
MPLLQTTAVSVTFRLDSSKPEPPYEVAHCDGEIRHNLGEDDKYVAGSNETGVANWALTFIPRAPTTAQSPFGNNQNTINGSGGSNSNGTFTLDTGNVKIKIVGDWDWSLMVQMTMPGGTTIKCFSSDPEMEVGP